MLNHADEYGFDARHIYAVGDSAGAHILGLYAAACTNPKYAAEYEFEIPEGFAPLAIALNCGKYVISSEGEFTDEQTKLLMEDFLPKHGNKRELKLISLSRHVTKNYPPTFLMTSVGDFLRGQAPVMAEKLASCNILFIYRFFSRNFVVRRIK